MKLDVLKKKLDGLKWVALDIETTHLDPKEGELLQFYGLGCDGESIDLKFKPKNIESASPYSLKVNKYEEFKEIYDKSKEFEEHTREIIDFLKGYDTVIGKNVHFDMGWLKYHLRYDKLPHRHFDLTTVAMDKLSGLIKTFGMEKVVSFVLNESVTHGAKSDVEQTLRCLNILLDDSKLVKLYLFTNRMFWKHIKKVGWVK